MIGTRLRIAAISGSLRKASYNTAALRAAAELLPSHAELEIHLLHDIPLFNEDVEVEGWPAPVQRLRDAIEPADGLLIATPEYNYSMPGVLKNALDWISRPTAKGPVVGKPLAIIGASPSITGTARAQAQVRQYAFYNRMPLVTHAEVLIGQADQKFDAQCRLTDKATREFMGSLLDAFIDWIERMSAPLKTGTNG